MCWDKYCYHNIDNLSSEERDELVKARKRFEEEESDRQDRESANRAAEWREWEKSHRRSGL